MSDKCFDDVDIRNANLSNTKALIDPQELYKKSLEGAILTGVHFISLDFSNVNMKDCIFFDDGTQELINGFLISNEENLNEEKNMLLIPQYNKNNN